MANNNQKTLVWVIIAAVVIIAGIFMYALAHTPAAPEEEQPAVLTDLILPKLAIAAENDSPAGVSTDSGFIISSEEPIDAATLTERLSLLPETDFTLNQLADNQLYLKPSGELAADTVYNIAVMQNSYEPAWTWAFQTKDSFRVTHTFPADQGSEAPCASGVEIYFSQPVADLDAHISISPALEGHLEPFDDKTVVFIPTQNMQPATAYTVTLDAATPSLAGDVLGEEVSFTFVTESSVNGGRSFFYPYDGPAETFTTDDPIWIKLYADSEIAGQQVRVDVYSYPTLDDYLAAYKSALTQDGEFLPTEDLTELSYLTSALLSNTDMYWNIAFLPLPQNPGAGWYLVDIVVTGGKPEVSGRRAQKLLQITDIAVYTQTADNQLLLWLNDAASGEPISGARVTVDGKSALSGKDGVALLTVPPQESDPHEWGYYDRYRYYDYPRAKKELRISQGERQFGTFADIYDEIETPWSDWSELYYTYVYTDRKAYQPDDTVRFWGVVMPRVSGAARPESINLEWTDGGRYPDGITVQIQPDGSFMGEIKLEKHVSGWEHLSFTLEERQLTGAYITILEYVKPVYTAQISLDKPYYRKGDTAMITVDASFFDGTPARDLRVSVSYDDRNNANNTQLYTDENGRAATEFTPAADSSWHPRYDYIYAESVGAEERSIFFHQRAAVFPHNYMFEAQVMPEEEGFRLALDGYAIDFSSVESGAYFEREDTTLLRGPRAQMRGQATLHQVEYVKQKTGEYYDFVNKVVVARYSYEREEHKLDSFDIQAENGRFLSELLPYAPEEGKYYYLELSLTAPDGAHLTDTCYAPGFESYYYGDSAAYQRYYFRQDLNWPNGENYIFQTYDGDNYYSGPHHAMHSLYDKVDIFLADQDDVQPQGGRILYTVISDQLHSYQTQQGGRFSLTFLPAYVPNAVVVGAYFDGKHIFSVSETSLRYDFPDSELNIQVKPNKERYQPGEEVTVSIEVTDQAGRPQAAHYLLSVADEAAFAVEEQIVKPLSEIYSQRNVSFLQYASYIQPYEVNYGAEGGEGGDGGVRRDFVDTVAFISGQTDARGQATQRFKLADNITSWRLTTLAFTEQNVEGSNVPKLGKSVENIPAGLPFFINPVINARYIAGDSIGCSLRGAGTAIKDSDTMHYTVTISGEGVNNKQSGSARAGDFTLLDFGQLPEGHYTVRLEARCGTYNDAIEKELEVVESLLLTSREQSGDLRDGINIEAKRFPVSLTLYDTDNKLYIDILYQMLYAYGQRADQSIVRALAGRRLNELFSEASYAEDLDVGADEEGRWRYGLRLFPYADTDPLLTAKALAVAPELLPGEALAEYFSDILSDKNAERADQAAAYMGLAALKKPVLLDIRRLLTDEASGFSQDEQLYLAIGLALLGDTDTAYNWYEQNLHQSLRSSGGLLTSPSPEHIQRYYKLAAEAAMLTTIVNHYDHRFLLLYLTENSSATYTPLLEMAAYVSKYSPRPTESASLSYNLGGQAIEHVFDKSPLLHLELGETQLAESDFQVLTGNVGYTAYYMGGHDELAENMPEGVALSQSLSTDSVRLGQNITVETTIVFDQAAPIGYYHVSLSVPTGLRFTQVLGYNYQCGWYYRAGEHGMIDFYIPYQHDGSFNEQSMPPSVTLTYEAVAVLPGSYVMEAPALQYSGSNTMYAGVRGSVTVTE